MKDHRYRIHATENINLRKRDPPLSLRTHYQVQNETQIRKNQKIIKNGNNQLEVKNYTKFKQPIIQKQKLKPPNCPTFKQIIWLETDECYFCRNCGYIINKQKHQVDGKVLRQDREFSTRLNYANKNIRETFYFIANTK